MAADCAGAPSEALELAHLQGFTGKFPSLVLSSCGADSGRTLIYTIGSVVVLEDAADAHEQRFLVGHDNDVSALAISPCGTYLASGQVGSELHVGCAAPVLVWRLSAGGDSRLHGERIYTLTGLTTQVRCLAFSGDSMLLVATAGMREQGGAPMVTWDMRAGQIVSSSMIDAPITTVVWVSTPSLTERPSYRLCTTQGDVKTPTRTPTAVHDHVLHYSVKESSYQIHTRAMKLPASGLTRTYTAMAYWPGTADGSRSAVVLAGTSVGELFTFSADSDTDAGRFLSSTIVAVNGVFAIQPVGDAVWIGAGNGEVRRLRRTMDGSWIIDANIALVGSVNGMSLVTQAGPAANATTIAAALQIGTDRGKIYTLASAATPAVGADGTSSSVARPGIDACPAAELQLAERADAHLGGVSAVAFQAGPVAEGTAEGGGALRSDVFCSASHDGSVRLWNLSTFQPILRVFSTSKATALWYGGDGVIMSGWGDGSIRAHNSADGAEVFEIVDAHRGGVTCVAAALLYIVSGGADNVVRCVAHAHTLRLVPDRSRVWRRSRPPHTPRPLASLFPSLWLRTTRPPALPAGPTVAQQRRA